MMFNYNKLTNRLGHILILGLALVVFACKKTVIGEDPYAGGKQPLGINFEPNTLPDPELAAQGSDVTVFVRGLMKFKDNFKFYVNEVEAQVVSFTDSTAVVKIPNDASTGGLSVVAEGQTFFGPILRIDGKVSIDATFQTGGATYRDNNGGLLNFPVWDIAQLPNGNAFVVGAFNNFDNRWTESLPNGGIAQIDASGGYVVPSETVNFGKGANGIITNVLRLTSGPHNGKYIIAGSFSNFASSFRKTDRINTMSNITRLTSNGKVDSTIIDVVNPTPNVVWKNKDTVPTFNGGVDNVVLKTFVYNNRIYLIGNFERYLRRFYERSTYDTKVIDIIRMKQMVCLKLNETNPVDEGDLDKTFHYIPAENRSPEAGNGKIEDAIQQPDGKLILVGAFTTFNGVPANRIVRINLDGSVDPTFNVGNGADNMIRSITYNAVNNKILIAGYFKNFAGSAKAGVAMLNTDGTLATEFNFGTLTDGIPNYAAQLNNGKVIVSGTFKTYNGIVRQGFMILNTDGSLATGYNNTGQFNGAIYKILENTSGSTTRVTLVGDIVRFDNKPFNGILRINIRN